MGDASTSRASKGKGVLGGLLRRVTGGRNESKEETTRTGVSLKDRFSALRGAAPTDPVPHQQRTLDDIHGPDENDVRVVHTSAARSMRFSDRVGMEPCADPFERRVSFDEGYDDHEYGDVHKGASDRERTPVGKYPSNRISFEDDVPCASERKDGIGSRYWPAERHVADVQADDASNEHAMTEEPAGRITLTERLKARQADKAKCPDAGTEQHDEESDTITEVVAGVCEKETVMTPVPDVTDTTDAELTEGKAETVPEEIRTDSKEEPAELPAAVEDVSCVMPIQIIEIMNPEPEAVPVSEAEDVIVTPVMPIQIIEMMNPEPEAVPVSEVPEMCIMIPDEIIEEACTEHTEEVTECVTVPFAEYLALMPADVEPVLIDDVCSRNMYEPATTVECIVPVVNEAVLEIENDVSLHDEMHDGDADDVESDIMRLLGGVIVDNDIIPATTVRAEPPAAEAPISEPVAEEAVFIPFAAFEAIAPEYVHTENEESEDEIEDEEPEDNEICFSFLSEWSTTSNAEIRFVWG